jgi:hypothetical protein
MLSGRPVGDACTIDLSRAFEADGARSRVWTGILFIDVLRNLCRTAVGFLNERTNEDGEK